MKKAILFVVGILLISGFAASGTTNTISVITKTNNDMDSYTVDDLTTRICLFTMNSDANDLIQEKTITQNPLLGRDYPIGTTIWQYTISGGSDTSVKAIKPIEDIDGDGIDDVIVCSEDNNVRCFSGGETGTGSVIWTHNIYSGNIYHQNGLTIIPDVNNDGYQDIVVGSTGGARNVSCISGLTGLTIWTYDTHEYPSGGWVYQVDCRYDYNNDGKLDVLACAGSDPDRVFCLNGVTGAKIWDYYLGGPGFGVISVEDFTGDGKPDVVAGCANDAETIGYAKGINGQTGALVWTFATPSGSPTGVWAVEQIDDVSGDGIKDVMIGDFKGNIFGLSAANGAQIYSNTIGSVYITRFVKLDDVNSDEHPDIVPVHSTIHTTQVIDGQTGNEIWSHSVADQPWNAARIADISGDNINDVVVGTLYNNNYCYFLNGVDGSELVAPIAYGEALDGMGAIPDVVADGSWEMVAGGRNGKLTCISGGLGSTNTAPSKPTIDGPTGGIVGFTYNFTFVATDPEENNISYYVDWNDGTNSGWVGPFATGVTATISHKWIQTSTYNIRAKAKDEYGYEGPWSDPFTFIVSENQPPNTPEINGSTHGKPKVELSYVIKTTDPDDDDVFYYVEWGDGSNTGWIGPYASGEEVSVKHTFSKKGTYTISVRAKDVYNITTNWVTLEVSIPRSRISENIFTRILSERFLRIFNILGFLF